MLSCFVMTVATIQRLSSQTQSHIFFYSSKHSKHSEHSIEVRKFQLLYRRPFQLKLFTREGKKEPVNSFTVD